MLRIFVVCAYVILCFRFGAWRRWREYYSTYLYAVIGDLAYNFLFYDKDLWVYDKLISHTFSDFLVAVAVFPCAITLFLTYYPAKRWKQAVYIFSWAALNTGVEYVSYQFGFILYYHNWNILWSMILYNIAFILVRIHYVKPLLAWPISFALAYTTMLLFDVPLAGLK